MANNGFLCYQDSAISSSYWRW